MAITCEQAIRAKALADSSVTALISSRWFSEYVVNDSIQYPLVVCTTKKSDPLRNLAGGGWVVEDIELAIWGISRATVKSVADALRICLDGFKGNVTVSATTVRPSVRLMTEENSTTENPDGGETPYIGVIQTYSVSMAQATS